MLLVATPAGHAESAGRGMQALSTVGAKAIVCLPILEARRMHVPYPYVEMCDVQDASHGPRH